MLGGGGDGWCRVEWGQKQKLDIARARLENSPMLILGQFSIPIQIHSSADSFFRTDEATSTLDRTSRIFGVRSLQAQEQDDDRHCRRSFSNRIEGFRACAQGGVVEQGFRYGLEGGGKALTVALAVGVASLGRW